MKRVVMKVSQESKLKIPGNWILPFGLFCIFSGALAALCSPLLFADVKSDFYVACVYVIILGCLFVLNEIPFIKNICER